MKAALSFESDAMKEAGERLNAAANTASSDYNATRTGRSGAFRSEIYAPGTEYQVSGFSEEYGGRGMRMDI